MLASAQGALVWHEVRLRQEVVVFLMAKHLKRRKRKGYLARCNISGLVILSTELDAKLALATRIRKDTGEKRYFRCGSHFHLTSEDARSVENESVAS